MDLNTLRDIVEKDGGKIFVFEEGKPLLVLMNFESYKKLIEKTKKNNSAKIVNDKVENIDLDLKEEDKSKSELKSEEDLEIDDLNL